MPQFLKMLLASCLGTALALFLLMVIGIGWIASIAGSSMEKETTEIAPNSVLELDFGAIIPEKTNNLEMDPFNLEED